MEDFISLQHKWMSGCDVPKEDSNAEIIRGTARHPIAFKDN